MASSSGGPNGPGGSGPSSWRSGHNSGGGSDRMPTSGSSSSHPHHHQQQIPLHSNTHSNGNSNSNHNSREKNHETVVNLLSMLTLGVDEAHPEAHQQSSSSSSSLNSQVDNQRMLITELANTPESCLALRKAGCIPLLIELIHPPQRTDGGGLQPPEIIRVRAAKALKNIVQLNADEKVKKKELRVLKFLEGIRLFSEAVKGLLRKQQLNLNGTDHQAQAQTDNIQHPTSSITTLMKLSFDEEHRHTMCLLGAIHALADLVVSDHLIHGNSNLKDDCLLLRRYSGMTLTNLTFNDGTNKALLCGMKDFLMCLVNQLECENEEVCQVTASVLRNLSWHADSASRTCLRDSFAVSKLMLAAVKAQKEATLKATLSALWNLSAHSAANKSAICLSSPEALPFLISLMRPNNPVMKQMKTPTTIIENAGGILRNISSHINCSSELRKTLRENHCYEILLEHLKSSSLTVVSNACGTLWYLSDGTDCEEDQRKLLDLKAIPMLKSLVYSKHERISQGASAALRNLLSSRFANDHTLHLDSRLTAQIYSPRPSSASERGGEHFTNQSLKSPGSDTEYDNMGMMSNNHCSHPQVVQPEPPAAHQSSLSSRSLANGGGHHKIISIPFHNQHQPQPSLPYNNYQRNRPNTIGYMPTDSEPLDLTVTSAKSSPIHVISAAEFGMHSIHHGRSKGAQNLTSAFYHPQSQSQNLPFFNSPNLIHQNETTGHGPVRKYSFPGAKFNQSCPEILSRFQQQNTVPSAATQTHQAPILDPNPKPLDYSSTSASTSSSTRGAGEATPSVFNDSNGNGGGEGDTTFNYSLRFSEADAEDEARSHNQIGPNPKSDDTVKTYYCEGTPHNFSISNSCQDLVQELEYEKETETQNNTEENAKRSDAKLQPIDEIPKSYYVENTPAAYSRRSSLSSIHSSEGFNNAGENPAEYSETISNSNREQRSSESHTPPLVIKPIPMERGQGSNLNQVPPQPLPRKKILSQPHTPCRVTFSADETPLMFSRCSSVASLESLDVGGGAGVATKNDDELSDYSRRASEVVSPSDIPDSPRALAPPVRIFEQQPKPEDLQGKRQDKKPEEEDSIKIFSISMEEQSGLQSCRSLSPLTVDGEELPIIGRDKLNSKEETSTDASSSTVIENKSVSAHSVGTSSVETSKPSAILANRPTKMSTDGKLVFGDDELNVFAMEGTPFYGVSTATSLSDLMADIDDTPELPKLSSNSKKPLPIPIAFNPNAAVVVPPPKIVEPVEEKSKSATETVPGNLDEQQPSTNVKEEPIYSDAQLLEKCIRVGKAMGIPKSHSEFRIASTLPSNAKESSVLPGTKMTTSLNRDTQGKSLEKQDSKSQDFEFDDPDLAALIQIGRNRTKGKDKSSVKGKINKKAEKPPAQKSLPSIFIPEPEITSQKPSDTKNIVSQKSSSLEEQQSSDSDPKSTTTSNVEPSTSSSEQDNKCKIPQSLDIDPNQVSTMSLGSEWNDETPTFSSPIPSMSISTALKLAGSICDSSSAKAPIAIVPVPNNISKSELEVENGLKEDSNEDKMNASCISISMQHELLENIDPPSTFSNLVSSTDCVGVQSPQLQPRSQNSTLSDRLNRKWKALNDPGNISTHSNLSGQKPPADFDLENSMISVASIKSEIYELSSASNYNNDIFESAVEEFDGQGQVILRGGGGDNSLGGNTYTIFPPENANRLSGVKSTDLSDGNTVISEDFTDAEDIEEFETAPMDDTKPEKSDTEKSIPKETQHCMEIEKKVDDNLEIDPLLMTKTTTTVPLPTVSPLSKPLMQVHPLIDSTKDKDSQKYNTFVVRKSPMMSPKSSPRQKRKEDPDRYRTRTINPINMGGKSIMSDANGNPELKFATFRVGGPKVIKPLVGNNLNSDSDSSLSPGSSPGQSPKGIRGRRKPLYSSLPPSAIIRNKKATTVTASAPPVPPKPVRAGSPARSITSTNGGVYVRPTRTTELRMANQSRDNSPLRRGESASSRNSSNSSLNLIHQSSRFSDTGIPIASPRPKVAPKPPVRTTPSMCSIMSSGGTSQNQIKTSNSTFGFGQARIGDTSSSGLSSNDMKGYSTLPKSSKLATQPFSSERYHNSQSRESVAGSEKSSKSTGIGKITNLWKKMDFRSSKENSNNFTNTTTATTDFSFKDKSQIHEKKSTGSKFTNLFARHKKDKEKDKITGQQQQQQQQKPFRDPLPIHSGPTGINFACDGAPASTGGLWVRRDGENTKVTTVVPPFNYTPPSGQKSTGDKTNNDDDNELNPPPVGSSKITMV